VIKIVTENGRVHYGFVDKFGAPTVFVRHKMQLNRLIQVIVHVQSYKVSLFIQTGQIKKRVIRNGIVFFNREIFSKYLLL
jgi:hypothetical protein